MKQKVNPKTILNVFIIVALVLIIFIPLFIYDEILTAKKECKKISGNYSIGFPLVHHCNNKPFSEYIKCINRDCKSFWGFESDLDYKVNLTEILRKE